MDTKQLQAIISKLRHAQNGLWYDTNSAYTQLSALTGKDPLASDLAQLVDGAHSLINNAIHLAHHAIIKASVGTDANHDDMNQYSKSASSEQPIAYMVQCKELKICRPFDSQESADTFATQLLLDYPTANVERFGYIQLTNTQ